jgi:hypothetical protein
LAVGVGHDEDSFAAVQRSNVGSSPHAPSNAIPHVGQVPENAAEEPSRFGVEETGNILPDEPSRSNLAKDTGNLGPEVTIVSRRLTLSCNGMRLAREPTGDELDCNGAFAASARGIPPCLYGVERSEAESAVGVGHNPSHVIEARDSGPSFAEDSLAVGVSLHKGDCFKASPFRGQIQPADAREEGEVFHPLEPK